MTVICALCHDEITDTRSAFQAISGWEKPRSKGGGNAIALRKTYPHWAHPSCIDKQKRVGVAQTELF